MRSTVSFFHVTAISLIALLVLAPAALAAETDAVSEEAVETDASAPMAEEAEETDPAPSVVPDVAPTPRAEVSGFERVAEGTAIGLDILILRPLSFAAVVVGAPMFLIAAPFAAIDGQLGATYDVFLQVPIDYAAWRPLGDL